jgi:hypothetical protein
MQIMRKKTVFNLIDDDGLLTWVGCPSQFCPRNYAPKVFMAKIAVKNKTLNSRWKQMQKLESNVSDSHLIKRCV